MKAHTQNFKDQIKELGREIESRITYGENTITSEELFSISPIVNGDILKSVMKELEFESSIQVPLNTVIKYEFGLKVNGEYEYINYGNFIVYSSEYNEDTKTYNHTCYDSMLNTMKDYEVLQNGNFPMTIREYLNNLCLDCGLTFKNKNSSFANYDKVLESDLYANLGYTYRDIFDQLAQVTASTICIDTDNLVEVRYVTETNDIIDEEYLKDINVKFGEKYGPINSIVLSRSSESDNIFLRDEESVSTDGLCEIKIIDNEIMNFNDRSDYLPDILEKLNGLEYYINDYTSTGILYYDLCDRYTVKIGENTYSCVLFNDEQKITQGITEDIYTELPEESVTDYSKADKTDRRLNQIYIIANKQEKRIDAVVQTQEDLSDTLIPLATSNGVELKLEKSAGQPLVEFELEGNCYQESEPTPDNPQEITVIEGDLSLVDEGEQSIETTIDLQGNFIAKLPNGTKDRLYLSQGHLYLEQNVGKVVFNGTENWKDELSANAYVTIDDAKGTNLSLVFSDRFIGVTSPSIWGKIKFGNTNKNLIFYKGITEKGSLANFQTWLSENNVTVYYELATPVIHDLGEYSIETLTGNSTIRAISNLQPSNMYCKYIRDIEGLDVFQTKNDMADYYNIEATESRISATKGVIELSVENNKKLVDEQGKTINALDKKVTQKINDDGVEFKTIKDTLQNGVETLKNTLVTININGIQVSTNTSKISTIMTNDKFAIQDNTGTYLAYFGYDEEEGRSKAEMDNLTVRQYFTAGYHRTEGFTDEETNEPRTGWFYVGGSI